MLEEALTALLPLLLPNSVDMVNLGAMITDARQLLLCAVLAFRAEK